MAESLAVAVKGGSTGRRRRDEVRVDHQPGFVLHTTAWRETSLIVEAFTDPERDPLQAELFEDAPKIVNGKMKLKEQPGLGLTLSEAAIRKYGERVI